MPWMLEELLLAWQLGVASALVAVSLDFRGNLSCFYEEYPAPDE